MPTRKHPDGAHPTRQQSYDWKTPPKTVGNPTGLALVSAAIRHGNFRQWLFPAQPIHTKQLPNAFLHLIAKFQITLKSRSELFCQPTTRSQNDPSSHLRNWSHWTKPIQCHMHELLDRSLTAQYCQYTLIYRIQNIATPITSATTTITDHTGTTKIHTFYRSQGGQQRENSVWVGNLTKFRSFCR